MFLGTQKSVASAAATNSKTTNKKDKEAVVEVAGVGEGREGEEKEGEGREEEEESDNEEEEEEESISDDPDRLWCVCRKPHNDRLVNIHVLLIMQCSDQNEWSGGPNKSRIEPQLPESAYTTCKSGGYLPVSGGQLAL